MSKLTGRRASEIFIGGGEKSHQKCFLSVLHFIEEEEEIQFQQKVRIISCAHSRLSGAEMNRSISIK